MKKHSLSRIDCSFYNEYGHFVELNVFYFSACILVTARICNDELNYVVTCRHNHSRRMAIKEALQRLYRQSYGPEKNAECIK